jgi:hypothetical protein
LQSAALPLLLAMLSAIPAPAQSEPPLPREDTQYWNEVQAVVHARRDVDWISSGMIRFGHDVSNLIYERFFSGVAFKLGKHFDLMPWCGYFAFQPDEDKDIREYRLAVDGTFRWTFGKLVVSDRNRVERRFFTSGQHYNRYRNRIQIEHPLRFGSRQLRLTMGDEVQYDAAFGAWNRNRIAAGVGIPLHEGVELEVYYMRQNDGYVHPGDLNVIGTNLRLSFF